MDLTLTRGTAVIVHGQDLAPGARWIDAMRRYGTNIVGCVSPSSEHEAFGDLPIFPNCADASAATGAQVCVSVMPPRTAADSVLEAAEAGIRLIVSLSAGVPIHDTMRVRRRISELGVTWIGAASSGIARPAEGVILGAIPADALAPGSVAIISTSGHLATETGYLMREAGLGQSLYVDVGSDIVKGTRLSALAGPLDADEQSRCIVLLGSAEGTDEEEFSEAIRDVKMSKPVLAYIAGRSLPEADEHGIARFPGAAAIAQKEAALVAVGATVYNSLGTLVAALKAFA